MKKNWAKQLTRENTLLDRSLRVIAYDRSLSEIGQASISNTLIVGQGRVTSLYYLPSDYKKTQGIILKEFSGKNIAKMSRQIVEFLEQGYLWAKQGKNKKFSKPELLGYLKIFNLHHAHARGAIVYGYWGEPKITEKIKKVLSGKINQSKIDSTLSLLSSPKIVGGKLSELRKHSPLIENKKNQLIAKLNLSPKQHELIEILSWFTLFYEAGELVSSYLYDELLKHIRKISTQKEFDDLMWYDPISLAAYFKGKKLSNGELEKRKDFWIAELFNGKLKFLSGQEARRYYQLYVPKDKIASRSEIKGTVASIGKATGKVKIIITQDDQKKMNKGDILVSPMTTPRLMAAIRKAAAIVTDEGGMTAHAAIVSREFGIPCNVGTKIATKVFKDGDKVEVDATKGVIRKL